MTASAEEGNGKITHDDREGVGDKMTAIFIISSEQNSNSTAMFRKHNLI